MLKESDNSYIIYIQEMPERISKLNALKPNIIHQRREDFCLASGH